MNWLDFFILISLLAGMVSGFFHGFVKEAAAFIGLIIGLGVGFSLMDVVAQKLAKNLEIHSEYLPMISFLIILMLVYSLIILMGKLLDKMVKVALLGIPNRIAGAFFGFAKTTFLLSSFLWIVNQVSLIGPKSKAESMFFTRTVTFAPSVLHAVAWVFPPAGKVFPDMEHFFEEITPTVFEKNKPK